MRNTAKSFTLNDLVLITSNMGADDMTGKDTIVIPDAWGKCVITGVFTADMELMYALTEAVAGVVNHDTGAGTLVLNTDGKPVSSELPRLLQLVRDRNPEAEFEFPGTAQAAEGQDLVIAEQLARLKRRGPAGFLFRIGV